MVGGSCTIFGHKTPDPDLLKIRVETNADLQH
jgi:hypothetical protein